MLMADDTVGEPWLPVARTVRTYVPTRALFQLSRYGELLADPIGCASAKNSTFCTEPSASAAFAVSRMGLGKVKTDPSRNCEKATEGGRVKVPVIVLFVSITTVSGFCVPLVSPLQPTKTVPLVGAS